MTARMTSRNTVRAHLDKYRDSPHFAQFAALSDSNRNSPLKCVPKVRERFGTSELDFPSLGKRLSPFQSLKAQPTPKDLREMLLTEVKRAVEDGETVWVPDDLEGKSAQDAALDLVQNLENLDYTAKGFIPDLQCPALEAMTAQAIVKDAANMTETSLECLVFPRDVVVPLQHHNETTSFSTLLMGSIMWIIWPPTDQNIGTLHRAYDDFAIDCNEKKLDIAHKLTGGVCCVQSDSEGLRIPPYCIMMGLTTAPSVLVKYSTLSGAQFLAMLRRLPFLEAWWKTEVDGDEKRKDFGRELLPRVKRILSGELDGCQPTHYHKMKSGALVELVTGWEQLSWGIVKLLDDETAKGIKQVWTDFLIGVVGRKCAICGHRTNNKGKELAGHFERVHWPKAGHREAQDTKRKRVGASSVGSIDEKAEKRDEQTSDTIALARENGEDGDPMEVDG
jgi:hypothetical protein